MLSMRLVAKTMDNYHNLWLEALETSKSENSWKTVVLLMSSMTFGILDPHSLQAIVQETMEILETISVTNVVDGFCYQFHGAHWFY